MGLREEMEALVSSVNDHKKFKQLACYSIDCLSKVVCPPNARWRENLEMATDCGAAKTIIDVMKLHPGNEQVLVGGAECLAKLAVDPRNAEIIAAEGGVEAMLASIEANPNLAGSATGDALALLDKLCNHHRALEHVASSSSLLQRLQNLMMMPSCDGSTAAAITRSLEKISRTQGGAAKLLSNNVVFTLMGFLNGVTASEFIGEQEEEAVANAIKIIQRLEREPGGTSVLRDANATDVVMRAMDMFPDSARIARLGGKVLSKMTGENIEDLLSTLTDSGALQGRALNLLAALATDSTSAEEIMRIGGMASLQAAFQTAQDAKTLETSALLVGRLADNINNVPAIIEGGLVADLVAALGSDLSSADSSAAALEALLRIANTGDFARSVVDAGALPAAVQALSNFSGDAGAATKAMNLLASLGAAGMLDSGAVVAGGGIPAIVQGMAEGGDDAEVQIAGLRSLACLADSEAAIAAMLSSGAGEAALQSLRAFVDSPEVLKESMTLLAALAATDGGLRALEEAGALDGVVKAMMASTEDAELREAAMALVAQLSSPEVVAANIQAIQAAVQSLQAGDTSVLETLPAVSMTCATLAMAPENAAAFTEGGGVDALLASLQAVSGLERVPHQKEVLATLCHAIRELAVASPEALSSAERSGAAVAAVVQTLQRQGKQAPVAAEALRLLSVLASQADEALHAALVDAGAIEAVAAALNRHAADGACVAAGAGALEALSFTPAKAALAHERGAARAALLALRRQAELGGDAAAMKKLLATLTRFAGAPGGEDALNALGALDTVLLCMDAHPEDEGLQAAGLACVEAFLRLEDIAPMLEKLPRVTPDIVAKSNAARMGRVRKMCDTVGVCMLIPGVAGAVAAAGGVKCLADVVAGCQMAPPSAERSDLLKAALRALGRIGGAGVAGAGAAPIAPFLVEAVSASPSVDVLRALAGLALDPEARAALAGAGAVAALAPLMSGVAAPETARLALRALTALCAEPAAAGEVLAAGGVAALTDLLADAVDAVDGGGDAAEALALLVQLSEHCDARELVDAGLVDTLSELLSSLQRGGAPADAADAATMATVSRLLAKLCADAANVEVIMAKGVVAKDLQILDASLELQRSPEVVTAAALLVESIAVAPGTSEGLQAMHASEVMMHAMTAVGGANMEALAAAAAALSAVSGEAGAENLRALVQRIDAKLDELAGSEDPRQSVQELTELLQLSSNLMLMADAVDAETGAALERSMYRCLDMLRGLELSAEQEAAVGACLDAIGRLMSIDAAQVDVEGAATAVAFTFDDGASPLVIEAACACVGNIALSTSGVRALASHGVLGRVQRVAHDRSRASVRGTRGASGAARAAEDAMASINAQCVKHAAMLVQAEDGAATLAEILCGIDDQKQLAAILASVLPIEGGAQALLDALVAIGPDKFAEHETVVLTTVKALLSHRDATGQLAAVTTAAQVATLAGACALDQSAVVLLEGASLSAEGCRLIAADAGALEALKAALGGREEVALSAAQTLAKLASHNDHAINAALREAGVGAAIVEALRQEHSAEFVQNALYALRTMAENIGVHNLDLSKEAMRLVDQLVQSYPDDAYIAEVGGACMAVMAAAFAGGTEALIEERLHAIDDSLGVATGQWQEVFAEDGRVYYYNATTGETQWEQPEAHKILLADLDNIANLVESIQDSITDVDLSGKLAIVNLLGTHARDRRVMGRVCRILETFTKERGNARMLSEHEHIQHIVAAMQQHGTDAALLSSAAHALEKLSKHEHMRQKLSSLEYISVLNQTIINHVERPALVAKCLGALANLAYNNPPNIAIEVQLQVHETAKLAAKTHPEDQPVQEGFVAVVSNVLYESDENKLIVCTTCADEILAVLDNFPGVDTLVTSVLRCMGNLSLVDEAVMFMVRRRAVERMVVCMEVHSVNLRVLKTSMEVISNFAAMEDEEEDAEATRYINDEGGLDKILEIVRENSTHPELLSAGMDALYNLGNDSEAAALLVEMGVLELALDILEANDHEAAVAGQCLRFLSVLTYSPAGVEAIADHEGVEAVLRTMQKHLDSEDIISDAMLTVSNTLVLRENRMQMKASDGLQIVVQLMNLPLAQNSPEIMRWVIKGLTRLATEDELSIEVAQVGMHIFVDLVSKYLDDIELLSMLFELFAQLAFVRENLRVIVQAGAIKIILKSMEFYDTDPSLMVKAIAVLDNVVSADEEYATLVMQKGGKEAVERVKAQNQYDAGVVQAADAAILSMEAMARSREKEGTKTNRGALFARLGGVVDLKANAFEKVGEELVEPTSDPLAFCRSTLRSGQLLTFYDQGASMSRHLFVGVDWTSIILKETAKKARSGIRLPLRNIRKIRKGLGEGHFRRGLLGGEPTTQATEERAFYIVTTNGHDLFLEMKSENSRDELLRSLDVLISTFRNFPSWLVPQGGR